MFSKTEAYKLPGHRPYDLSILLQEGTTPPFGPVYDLSPLELNVLRKYIDDNLQKGFVCHSQSPAGALYRAEIHHLPWPLQTAVAEIDPDELLEPHGLRVEGKPATLHFAQRVDVVVWPLEAVQ